MFHKIILLTGFLFAEIHYSLNLLSDYRQEEKGFHRNDFWEAMRFGRNETAAEFYVDPDVLAVKANFDRLCAQIDIPSEQTSIPHVIHLIWLGSNIHEKVGICFDSWKKHHPDWEVKIWTDKEVAAFDWSSEHSKVCFEEADTWAEKADILRLEVLYRFGGIYSDADVVCLNSFDLLTRQEVGFFSSFELNYVGKHYGEPFFVGSAVMGSSQESQVMKYCIENLKSKKEAPEVGIIKRTGPGLISRACQTALHTNSEHVLILPCSYIYALPWKERETNEQDVLNYVSPDSLAIHLWDGSWCTHKKKK